MPFPSHYVGMSTMSVRTQLKTAPHVFIRAGGMKRDFIALFHLGSFRVIVRQWL